jgi:hypothetical protein
MKKPAIVWNVRLSNDDLWLANQSRPPMKKLARVADSLPNDGLLWLANQSRAVMKKLARAADVRLPNDGL